jgi:hypothetical protein
LVSILINAAPSSLLYNCSIYFVMSLFWCKARLLFLILLFPFCFLLYYLLRLYLLILCFNLCIPCIQINLASPLFRRSLCLLYITGPFYIIVKTTLKHKLLKALPLLTDRVLIKSLVRLPLYPSSTTNTTKLNRSLVRKNNVPLVNILIC